MTTIAVFGYLLTGKARFLVSGDKNEVVAATEANSKPGLYQKLIQFFSETYPDHRGLRASEFIAGKVFLGVSIFTFQIAFIGLVISFMLMPFMHHFGGDHKLVKILVWIPFTFILLGISLGGMRVLGIYPVMFNFGFHF